MKFKLTAGLSALALAACTSTPGATTGSTVGSLFNIVPDVLQSSFDNWVATGQSAKSQISFTNTESFDGQLYASLDRNRLDDDGKLRDVFVEFEPGTLQMPKRNIKWLSVVAAKHGELRKCDVHDPGEFEGILDFVLAIAGFAKDALQVKEVIRYKAIIEYNSAEEDIDGIRYYDASIPTAEKEEMYPEGQCESITLQDLMDTALALSSSSDETGDE